MMSGQPLAMEVSAPLGRRPSHQLHRSVSAISNGMASKHHRSHSHHLHLHRRDKEDKSLGLNLLHSRTHEWTRSEGVTPNDSRNASRRTSLLASAEDSVGLTGLQRFVSEAEVKAEKENNALRAMWVLSTAI